MTIADEATATRNKAVIRRHFEVNWNEAPLDAAGNDLAAGATNFRRPTDVDQVQRIVQNWRTAFPDLHYTVDTLLAEDDQILAFCTLSGTQHGPLPLRGWAMLPSTGKHFEVKQMHLFRLRDGKVTEHWGVRDDLEMLLQLGHVAPPEQVGEHVADVLRDQTV